MGFCLPDIKSGSTVYPLLQISDTSILSDYNSYNQTRWGFWSGHITPEGISQLGQDWIAISSWIPHGDPSVDIVFSNAEARLNQYFYYMSGGYDANGFRILHKESDTAIANLLGTAYLTGMSIYWGVYIDDVNQYGYVIKVFWNSNNTTELAGNGGNNQVGREIYEAFYRQIHRWSTVSMLTGKSSTLHFTQINPEYLSNGSPVTNVSSSAFTGSADSHINELVALNTPIDDEGLNANSITCVYRIDPKDIYSSAKLLVKKNSAPTDEGDADLIVSLARPTLSTGVNQQIVRNLDESAIYYVRVKIADSQGHSAISDASQVTTNYISYEFQYTGAIQTFTAPRTGFYSLETWGAQGGDATDGENVARGGYGAYAYGEMLLNQGDMLYIGVGGQDGYNGGGMKVWDGSEIDILWSGNNNKMTAQIDNSTILFKMYTSNTEIYSFTSQVGTSVSDIGNINIGFLIDTTNEVAKPSFIYDNGNDTYTYNAESPTDAEMALIYTWLSAGLSSG